MNESEELILQEKFRLLQQKLEGFLPEVVVVLGSGLGEFAKQVNTEKTIRFKEIGLPESTVAPERSLLRLGRIGGVRVALLEYRLHYYEGYTPAEIVRPLRLLRMAGAKILLLTNAVGGINRNFQPGDLMLIDDHISSFMPSPLRGANVGFLGPRFADMSQVYSPRLRKIFTETAEKEGITLKHGVLIQVPGPQFETPAEIRAFAGMGADAVGMSSAIEALAARHCGYEVAGISCISNLASGISPHPLSEEEVYETASRIGVHFRKLLFAAISASGFSDAE